MFQHEKIQNLSDFFTDMNNRRTKGAFFYRINCYNEEIDTFIRKYYDAARRGGAVIEGRIPNPDEKNLSYYREIMGDGFSMDLAFIHASIRKWLPRMNEYQSKTVSASIFEVLKKLQQNGKNANMLKNAYIKFMCWMYYKFEQVLSMLGTGKVPKILYEGEVSNYELLLLAVLSNAGCDIVLLQYGGDQKYLTVDPSSMYSDAYVTADAGPFPQGFCLKQIRENAKQEARLEGLYGPKPEKTACTNAWIEGNLLLDIQKPPMARGDDPNLFYNCFGRINGVEDKLTYENELFQMYLALKNSKRNVVVVDKGITKPTPDEIAKIKRGNYPSLDVMLRDLTSNFRMIHNEELKRLVSRAFIDIIMEDSKNPQNNINRLLSRAVTVLCYFHRYYSQLLGGFEPGQVGCFILLGYCEGGTEAMFVKMLSRIPVDVLLLNPSLQKKCCLEDRLLFEMNFTDALNVSRFPVDNTNVQIGTAAYHAERELDQIMYDNSGIYRVQQYQKARSVYLKTMYEEIQILWEQELKYRPSFAVVDDVVNIPAIFAKVNGVKDGNVQNYWYSIRKLLTEDTFLISRAPFIDPGSPNPMKAYSTEFLRNGRLQREKIKTHKEFQYGFLREEMQEHMLDKLQQMINEKMIRGISENGMEYTVVATVLNLPKEIVRLIQKFDFTRKNPKLVYVHAGETAVSVEDAIITAFLSMVGFDVVFFVPTGYQSVERHFQTKVMEEHQIGEYKYDLQVPDLRRITLETRHKGWREILFKRGT